MWPRVHYGPSTSPFGNAPAPIYTWSTYQAIPVTPRQHAGPDIPSQDLLTLLRSLVMLLSPEGPGFNPRQSVRFMVDQVAQGQGFLEECQFYPVIITLLLHAYPFICQQCYTVEPRFTNLICSWRPLVTWNVRKLKLLWSHGVLFNNILKNTKHNEIQEKAWRIRAGMCTEQKLHNNWHSPADTPSLSPACVAGLCVRYLRYRSSPKMSPPPPGGGDLFVMGGVREPRFHCIILALGSVG
jgi:hypothetical protein